MYDQIIDEVVNECIKRLQKSPSYDTLRPICLVLGQAFQNVPNEYTNSYELVEFDLLDTKNQMDAVSKASCILVTSFSVSNLSHIALGVANTSMEKAILKGLLLGKEIRILQEALTYQNYKNTASKVFYRRLQEYEEIIVSYGIRLSTTNVTTGVTINKRLILEKDLIGYGQMPGVRIQVARDSIITPMAADYAKTHQIEIMKQ